MKTLTALTILTLAFTSAVTRANCTSPAAAAGAKHYVYASHKYQYCDGTTWQDLPVSGTIAGPCTEARWKYDSTLKNFKYCDGTNYRTLNTTLNSCANPDWTAASQKVEFTGSDVASGDYFGGMANYGNIIIVGAGQKTVGANIGQGEAYLFDFSSPTTPIQLSKFLASDGVASDNFGYGVAISENLALVGAPGKNTNKGAAYLFDVSNPSGPLQKSILTASDGVATDHFGNSVAIGSNIVAVGADTKVVSGNANQGVVYLFDVSTPTAPVQKSEIIAPDGHSNDQFGYSVVIKGHLLYISAIAKYIPTIGGAGAYYIYDIGNPASPVYKSEFTSSDIQSSDNFGASIAVQGTLALVGAFNTTVGANMSQGSAYLFDISNPSKPVQKAKITASDGAASDQLGTHVALKGKYAFVTSGKTVGGNTGQGAVYVYDLLNPAAPAQKNQYVSNDGATYDGFGSDLIFTGSDSALIIGASGKNSQQGTAYVFQVNCASQCTSFNSWGADTRQKGFTSSDGAAYDEFGATVAVSGNTAVVGAFGKTVGTNTSQGQAYVFDLSNPSSPVQKATIVASNGAANDSLGDSISMSGNIVVIGASGKTVGTNTNQGSAFIFDVSTPSSPVQKAQLTASDGTGSDTFGVNAISGNYVLVGAYNKTVGTNTNQGAAYLYDITTPTAPVQKAKLTASDGAAFDSFGNNVAISGNLALISCSNKTVGANNYQGAVYVFDITTPTAPVQKAKITVADGVANAYLGQSISLSGTTALIRANDNSSTSPQGKGVVYIYDLSTPASPVLKTELYPGDPAAGDSFGAAISISGTLALITSSGKTVGANGLQGAAYVFDISNPASPVQLAKLIASDGAANDFLGGWAAFSGNTALVGARKKPYGTFGEQGAAYTFTPSCASYKAATAGTCSSAGGNVKQGSLHYAPGGGYQFCDGSNWTPVGCNVPAVSFTNQSLASLSTTYSSNIVIPSINCDTTVVMSSGFVGSNYRICSDANCNTVLHNWTQLSNTISPGQYIQVQTPSSASYNTATSTVLSFGGTTRSAYSVKTWPGYKRVFVTSATYQGNFESLGVMPDTYCQSLANSAGLGGTWKAWVSNTTGSDDPATTFTQSTVPYKNVTGTTTIANNWAGLVSGTLLAGINMTEIGTTVTGNAWTNVASNGTATTSGSSTTGNCVMWTTNAGNPKKGNYGVVGSATSTWTASSNQICSTSSHLYCFEQ